MLHTVPKPLIGKCATAALIGAGMLAAAGTATAHHSSTPHPFRNASISWNPEGRGGPVPVLVGHDGKKYTHLAGEVSTRFRVRAEVKSGHRVLGVVIATTDPVLLQPHSAQLDFARQSMGAQTGDYEWHLNRHMTFTLPAAVALNTGIDGIHIPSQEQQAIDRCNAQFPDLPPTEQTVGQLALTVHAGFSSGKKQAIGAPFVDWGTWWPDRASGRPGIAFTTFPVSIVCLGKTDPRSGVVPPPERTEPEFNVTGVFLNLFHANQPLPAKLEADCAVPIGHNAIFKTIGKLPGNIRYRFEWTTGQRSTDYTKADKGDRKDPLYEQPIAYHEFPYPLPAGGNGGQPGPKGFVAEQPQGKSATDKLAGASGPGNVHKGSVRVVVTRPDGSSVASGWAPYHIACKQRPEVISGTLELRDGNGSSCPREAKAAISLRTSVPGPVSYRLDCTGDRSWSRVAAAHKTGPNTFIAVDVLPFDITRNEQVNCALKSDSPAKVVALRGRNYTCKGAGGGLVANPKTDVDPPRFVADPPRPDCAGGRLVTISTRPLRYACHCPQGQTAKTSGPNSFRCEGRTPVTIACAGGTIAGSQCTCPPNTRRVQAGANAWRCERVAQPPRRNISAEPLRLNTKRR